MKVITADNKKGVIIDAVNTLDLNILIDGEHSSKKYTCFELLYVTENGI